MSPRLRFAGYVVFVMVLTVTAGYAANRLVLKLAEEHQPASPQLAMAAAMGGLFAGGLVALLAILILARTAPR